MQRLYVLYDVRCGVCRWSRQWLESQPKFIDLTFIPAESSQARSLFPALTTGHEPEELIVVSDSGHVYREGSAWIMCLFALTEYREWSIRLASPTLLPFARRAFAVFSKQRKWISNALKLESDDGIALQMKKIFEPPCNVR